MQSEIQSEQPPSDTVRKNRRSSRSDRQHLDAALAQIQQATETSARYANQTPWLSEKGEVLWDRNRIRVAKVVMSQGFESLMGIIIVFNIVVMIFETDQDAMCYPAFEGRTGECPHSSENVPWIVGANNVLLAIYTVEAATRVYVERGEYLWNRWNQIDAVTVIAGWITTVVSGFINLNFLRSVRAVRVIRAARVLISIREVAMLLSGFMSAMRAIFFGCACLFCVNIIWSILLVQIVHPVNSMIQYDGCDYCGAGYASVWNAFVTLFQTIIAGDSWGAISVPAVRKAWWLFPVFASVVIIVGLGIMNLILAVIVERATEAREMNNEAQAKQKAILRKKNMVKLATICHQLDEDCSGTMSLAEIVGGFDESEEFKSLITEMDLERTDLEAIFSALDTDGTGEISYLDFCQKLDSAKSQDTGTTTMLLQFAVKELKNLINHEVIVKLNSHEELLRTHLELLQKQANIFDDLQQQKVEAFAAGQDQAAPVEEKAKQEAPPDEKLLGGSFATTLRQTMEELASLQQSSQELAIATPMVGRDAAISGPLELAEREHALLRSALQQGAFQLGVSLASEEALLSKKRQIQQCLAGCLGTPRPPSLREVLQWQDPERHWSPSPPAGGSSGAGSVTTAPRFPHPLQPVAAAPAPELLGLQGGADDDELPPNPPPPISNL